jgi:hypothetical protein
MDLSDWNRLGWFGLDGGVVVNLIGTSVLGLVWRLMDITLMLSALTEVDCLVILFTAWRRQLCDGRRWDTSWTTHDSSSSGSTRNFDGDWWMLFGCRNNRSRSIAMIGDAESDRLIGGLWSLMTTTGRGQTSMSPEEAIRVRGDEASNQPARLTAASRTGWVYL